LANIEGLPKSILFWRSLTHWLGGMATLIFVIAALPQLNIGGYRSFSIGTLLHGKKAPGFSNIIKHIIVVYFALTVTQILLLYLGGMNLFESFCHSFGTVATGSFSPKSGSIEGYSPYIQIIMALFMMLAGMGYVFYFFLITGKLKTAIRNEEIRWYGFITLSVTAVITAVLYFKTGSGFEMVFRQGLFQSISFITTTGYSTANYLSWPVYALLLLFFFMLIGSCSGSVSGGIKIPRVIIFLKNLKFTFKTLISGNDDEFRIRYNEAEIDKRTNLAVMSFITIWVAIFMFGTIILSSTAGTGLKRSAFFAASSMTTFGHDISLNDLPATGKIILSILMLAGRLEVYPLLLLFAGAFYRRGED
jgi:trk system potassium uptake protein TrkH